MKNLTIDDELIINFLIKQKASRKYFLISSTFCAFVGIVGFVVFLIKPIDRTFLGGLYFLSLALVLWFTNTKFVKILELLYKIAPDEIIQSKKHGEK